MTQATKSRKAPKAEKQLIFIARAQFKATGAVLYGIRSEENVYHVTMIKGRVTGCCNATTGEDCSGFHYRKNCGHTKYATQLEEKRVSAFAPIAGVVEACHIAPECDGPPPILSAEQKAAYLERVEAERQRGVEYFYGHNDRIASMMDVPAMPVQEQDDEIASLAATILGEEFAQDLKAHVVDSIDSGEVVNPLAGLSADERYARYSTMYPDDYGYSAA